MPHYPRYLSAFDYRGFHRYFLTFCTFKRNPYFADAARSIVKYVIGNPIRGALVKDLLDYPFWGSGLYSREALIEYISRAG